MQFKPCRDWVSLYWQALQKFRLQPPAAAAHVAALSQLGAAQALAGQPSPTAWCGQVLKAAEETLGNYVEQQGGGPPRQDQAVMSTQDWMAATALFTIGEVTHLSLGV